jgi:cytochrome b involved in lipid metabolism
MSKEYDAEEVKAHKSKESAWVIVDGGVFDVTDFLEDHPGGARILLKNCGKDSSEAFWELHSTMVFEKQAKKLQIGTVKASSKL